MIYNYFNSPMSQTPTVVRVFPMELERREMDREALEVPHLLEPDPNSVLETLLPRYFDAKVQEDGLRVVGQPVDGQVDEAVQELRVTDTAGVPELGVHRDRGETRDRVQLVHHEHTVGA